MKKVIDLTFADDHKRAVVDPEPAPLEYEPARPKAKPKTGGDQGDLF